MGEGGGCYGWECGWPAGALITRSTRVIAEVIVTPAIARVVRTFRSRP